ncbi:MAG: ABC transporter substrate-binding protein [Synergistaceae bacterium]|jgi:branched-chain amino acid transport system substrate-binding protein|nr:ABC transporter substrate-binding protein [Synergistaceae bacterium]
MDDRPVRTARELIRIYGGSLLEDPDRLGQLLEDRCGDARREIFLLSFALRVVFRDGVIPSADDFASRGEKTEATLRDNLGFSKSDASWAAESIQKLLETCAEEGVTEARLEAHKGFLQNIGRVMAKRPRTALFRKKTLRNGLLLLFIIALFLGLFVRITESRYAVHNEHDILFLAHLSGPDAAFGHVRLKAAQLAADQRNASGGVKGRPIRIRPYDMPILPEKALERAREVLSDRTEPQPAAVISACGDDVNEAIAGLADTFEMPFVMTESSRVNITMNGRELPRLYVFRLNGDNNDKGRTAAYFVAYGLNRKKAAAVSEAYGVDSGEMKDGFIEAMKEYGGEVVCEEVWTKRGGIDRASVEEINAAGADVVAVLNRGPEAAAVVRSLRDFGYAGTIVGMSFDEAAFSADGTLDNTWWIVPAHPDDPQLLSFQSAYRDKYNENNAGADFAGTVFAYDSILWTANALSRAPGFQGEALRHAFMSTRNLALTHATLTIDPSTHGPLNKAWALVYCSSGSARFQRRFRPR